MHCTSTGAAEGVIAEPGGMARREGGGRGQSVNVMNGKLGLDNNEWSRDSPVPLV